MTDDVYESLVRRLSDDNVDVLIQSDARHGHNETVDWLCAGFIVVRSRPGVYVTVSM